MKEEYKPGPGGSATYDHLVGKITHKQYLAHIDRVRDEYGMPPIDRSGQEEAFEIRREGENIFNVDLHALDSEALMDVEDGRK